MGYIFTKVLNMSLSACWLILAVILLRFCLKKAPKWINCLMWALVSLRLCLPDFLRSSLSLIPSTKILPIDNIFSGDANISDNPYYFRIDSGIEAVDKIVDPVMLDTTPGAMRSNLEIFGIIWIIGISALLIWGVVSFFRLKHSVRISVSKESNVYYCDTVSSPFILGFLKPKIYLPSGISHEDEFYVISHEKAHIKRLDHIWKLLGYLILAVHWFNPLCWLAFSLFCKDIEKACDEKVIKAMDNDAKKGYSNALISCSVHRQTVIACPLAFGEVGVKERIKNILNYKKPAFWLIAVAIILSIVLTVCFLTNPRSEIALDFSDENYATGCDLEGVTVSINAIELKSETPYISIIINNNSEKELIYSEYFQFQYLKQGEFYDCDTNREYIANDIAHVLMPNSSCVKNYSLEHIVFPDKGIYLFKTALSAPMEGTSETETKTAWIQFKLSEFVKDSGSEKAKEETAFFKGKIIGIYENTFLIEPEQNEKIRNIADRVSVTKFVLGQSVPDFQVGENVMVVYNGYVHHTYPAMLDEVYSLYSVDNIE